MRNALFTLLLVLLTCSAVILINTDPDTVVISYGDLSLETSLWLALLLLLTTITLLYCVWRIICISCRVLRFTGIKQHLAKQQQQQVQYSCITAMISKDWQGAYTNLLKITLPTPQPASYHLALAYLAYCNGNLEEASLHISKVKLDSGSIILAADLHLACNQPQAAIHLLMKHSSVHSRAVSERLLAAYTAKQDWLAVIKTLNSAKNFSNNQLLVAYKQALANYLGSASVNKQTISADTVKLWYKLPQWCQQDLTTTKIVISGLIKLGGLKYAQQIIEHYCERTALEEEIIQFYHLTAKKNESASPLVAKAQKWLAQKPQSAAIMLCLGHLYAQLEQLVPAKAHAENSFMLRPQIDSLALYSDILKATDEEHTASTFLTKGIKLLATAGTDK